MGTFRHHTIVVIGQDMPDTHHAREKCIDILKRNTNDSKRAAMLVSYTCESITNQFYSFFIAPDGSKEGWDISDQCDNARKEIVEYLKKQRDKGICFIEIAFGGHNGVSAEILNQHEE